MLRENKNKLQEEEEEEDRVNFSLLFLKPLTVHPKKSLIRVIVVVGEGE
jgi:hypothetical protein